MTETQQNIIVAATAFIKSRLERAEGGHDWFHIERVLRLAERIAQEEAADTYVVMLSALLHDVADAKFHEGDEDIGPKTAKDFLKSLKVEPSVIERVAFVVRYISFKGGHNRPPYRSPELDIVQDADRLDAIGALGIARCFNYGGFKNRPLYDPSILPDLQMDKETYKKGASPSLNHFYEKLLLLKDQMNTKTGRILAEERHRFLEIYLDRFLKEWRGEV